MSDTLNILWTNGDAITSEKMVMMYAHNAKKRGWWENVTIIVWGAPARLAVEDTAIREKIGAMIADGVQFSACKACADQLGVSAKLEELGVEVKYWGEPLTEILKSGAKLLTV